MFRVFSLACLIILAGLVQNLNPVYAADFQSPRTIGLGTAGAAGPFINDAIYLNPSLVPLLLRVRSLSANFQTFQGDPFAGGTGASHGRVANASFQDGTAPLFEAGLGYTLRDDGGVVSIGASKSFFERSGFGLGYKLFMDSKDGKPSGSDALLSTTYIIQDWLTASVIVDNLFRSKASQSRNEAREFKLATKFNLMEIVLLYFDPQWMFDLPDGRKFGYGVGTEYPLFKELFFRIGAFKNVYLPFLGGRADGMGLGMGWIGPKISIDYGFQRVLGSPEGLPSANAHTFGMTVFF